MQIKILLTIFFSLFNLLIIQKKIEAHGVKISPEINQAISIQAKYDSDLPMNKAEVIVYAPNDLAKPWLKGTTDSQGYFMFIPDSNLVGNWQIKVRQAGHGDVINIPYSPLPDNIQAQSFGLNDHKSNHHYQQLQKPLMIASIVWGCVGTALFFARSKSPNFSDSKLSKERN